MNHQKLVGQAALEQSSRHLSAKSRNNETKQKKRLQRRLQPGSYGCSPRPHQIHTSPYTCAVPSAKGQYMPSDLTVCMLRMLRVWESEGFRANSEAWRRTALQLATMASAISRRKPRARMPELFRRSIRVPQPETGHDRSHVAPRK